MGREIDEYLLKSNPPPDVRRAWAKDAADIQNEIRRRQQAQAVGKKR